jgi:PKD-like domain
MQKQLSTFQKGGKIALFLLLSLTNSIWAADFSPKNALKTEEVMVCNFPILNDITPQNICLGGSFNSVSTSVLNGVSVTYQWYNDNGTSNPTTTAISGEITASLASLPTTVGSYKYKVVAINSTDATCFTEKTVILTIVAAPTSQEICSGESFTATAQTGLTNIQWKKDDGSGAGFVDVAGATSATLNITTAGTYKYVAKDAVTGCDIQLCCPIVLTACCPSLSNPSVAQSICVGTSGSDITVKSDKKVTNGVKFVKFTSDQTAGAVPTATELTAIYAGTSIATVTPTGSSTPFTATYTWNSADFPNATSAPITYYVYAITNPGTATCQDIEEIQITVKPIPTVSDPADQLICHNANTTAVNFTGSSVTGTTYSWTNDNTTIGLAASGTGNITSFTGTNTGTTNSVATITVTPTANGCTGSSQVFTITVKPLPTVTDPSDQTVLSAGTVAATTFSGTSGATFNWTNNNTATGLAASGTGNITSFTAATVTTTQVSTITVTPTLNGCTGTPQTFTITVNPAIPVVTDPADVTLCAGGTMNAVTFTGTSGATFNWTNDNTNVGIVASGTGDIAAFILPNVTTQQVANITVTPVKNGVSGTPQTFVLTINPKPVSGTATSITLCNSSTTAVDLASLLTGEGTGGTWTRTSGTGGTFTAGTGTFTPSAGVTTSTFRYTMAGTTPCPNESTDVTITFQNCCPLPNCGTVTLTKN